MTPDCKPRPNGYMDQIDCAAHGTPMGTRRMPLDCEVTAESWAAYDKSQTAAKDEGTICTICTGGGSMQDGGFCPCRLFPWRKPCVEGCWCHDEAQAEW